MGKHDTEIANDFVLRKPINTRLLSRVSASSGWASSGNYSHGLSPAVGTARFSYDERGVLWSYERMQLARWTRDDTLIVNADDGPSNMTKAQQRELRDAIARHKPKNVSLIPFSALAAARVALYEIELVAVTPDRELTQMVPCRNKHCEKAGTKHGHLRAVHFLGETLFRVPERVWDDAKGEYKRTGYKYFVSGLDRNDDPKRRNFFLAALPPGRPKTVDEALALLRPKKVPEDALRQGEWFLVPAPDKKFKPDQVIKDMKALARNNTSDYNPGVPLVSDVSEEQFERIKEGGWTMHSRRKRHRATRMVCNGAVYVSGMLRDEEHGALKLGDGKTWFKVVKNRATGSWRAGGSVD